MTKIEPFLTREALETEAASAIEAIVLDALAARGRAAIALSGGETPRGLYAELARKTWDWPSIALCLADERWADVSSPASNEGMARAAFAPALQLGARFTPMKTDAPSPWDALAPVNAAYAALAPFEAIVLGMGADGHTASWFPHATGLSAALDRDTPACVAAIEAKGAAGADARMTLTYPAIAAARLKLLIVTGAEKRAALERALEPGPIEDMPVRALLQRECSGLRLMWAP